MILCAGDPRPCLSSPVCRLSAPDHALREEPAATVPGIIRYGPRHELECGRRLCEHVLLLKLAVGKRVWEQLHTAVVGVVLQMKQTECDYLQDRCVCHTV